MSKTLLKSAIIVAPESKHHLKKRDILIDNGVITKIAANITDKDAREVSRPNLHVSSGWFDSSVSFGEPGYEDRETLENGLKTAAISGFTHVAVNPNTNPVIDNKSGVQFLAAKGKGHAVKLHPVGTITMGAEGKDLAELYDMHREGAVAFGDYQKPVENANLLKIALQYAQNFGGLVQSFPMEPSVAVKGVVNEHINSTRLGLKGIPALSEELQINRDLYLLEYTGGKLHIPTISSATGVKLVKEARKRGLDVSCSVAVNNIFLTDDVLETFDSNFKLLPPIRTEDDRKALIKGLKDGTIDGVTSDHNPIDIEHKKQEFDHAMFGSIGLESAFGALNKLVGFEDAVKHFNGLKSRFGIEEVPVKEGNAADLTLFDPDIEWEFTVDDIQSGSKNAALLGMQLKGRAYGIFSNKKLQLRK